jgi:hypothetical protein
MCCLIFSVQFLLRKDLYNYFFLLKTRSHKFIRCCILWEHVTLHFPILAQVIWHFYLSLILLFMRPWDLVLVRLRVMVSWRLNFLHMRLSLKLWLWIFDLLMNWNIFRLVTKETLSPSLAMGSTWRNTMDKMKECVVLCTYCTFRVSCFQVLYPIAHVILIGLYIQHIKLWVSVFHLIYRNLEMFYLVPFCHLYPLWPVMILKLAYRLNFPINAFFALFISWFI